jgi:CheY-like chemotaxis protein
MMESFRIETLETALIHRLVELLRGSLHIHPENHGPFALKVVLPVALRDSGLREECTGLEPACPAILVVDDNRISLRVLYSILSRAGFEAVVVDSGPAALDELAHRHFDLVLMDLLMPGMDGSDATQRIRSLPDCGSIPILGITAGVTEELRESCRRNGMDSILEKPVNATELVSSIRFHVGLS